nr:thioredoxin h (TRXH) [Polytomella parva]|eukprot:CAMPEP_0175053534 /NCGR_PEP_ID=MMETSP0052_2-20121109/8985_1 /TAXON_ID=51329 ORGANISM="Polytomella parva, Strain SAG 63-3" /NCGR_SAMPLE_ID=MMETSP0052_2 /ASSEMBLY_ACC=CAM_ASM_000194 /LENGTH=110 /DNA_ID=CAMNT_0016318093 /DNA_START=54 /DNA_END=386 /DNA_ORIENTATION=+
MSGSIVYVKSKNEWTAQLAQAAEAGKAVVVDFHAVWCGPCRAIAPFYESLSAKYSNVVFLKVDVDEVEAVASECGITGMPTFMLFKNNAKVDEFTGANKEKLETMVAKYN